jgi:hypothetical protein
VDSSDHSDIEDWASAALEEALKILNDWLEEAAIVVIVVVVVFIVALALAMSPRPVLALRRRRGPPLLLRRVGERLLCGLLLLWCEA